MSRRTYALVAAAGQGTRLGADLPKAFVELAGRSLLGRSVQSMVDSGVVDEVVVLVSPVMEDLARKLVEREVDAGGLAVRFVHGRGERADSVWAGLQAISGGIGSTGSTCAGADAVVLIHDAARALAPPELVTRVAEAVYAGAAAVIPVVPVADTIKKVDGTRVMGTPDRSSLRAVQTPQGFELKALRAANEAYFSQCPDLVATDDASLMEWRGVAVDTVEGDPLAFKITTPIDLTLARAILEDNT